MRLGHRAHRAVNGNVTASRFGKEKDGCMGNKGAMSCLFFSKRQDMALFLLCRYERSMDMGEIPVYSFLAYSGTGKTTFLTKLIAELKARGLRLGVIKHDAHDFELDRKGKDSWRFAEAGADVVAVASAHKAALMEYRALSLNELVSRMKEVDLILTEGYSGEDHPAVAVYRKASMQPLRGDSRRLIAIVTDTPIPGKLPCFGLDDVKQTADFLLGHAGLAKAQSTKFGGGQT